MPEARMTSKGQITVPKAVRVRLNLKAGDRVLFIVEDNGTATIRAVNKSIASLKGVLPPPKRKATLEEIEDAIARGAVADALGHDWD
jgi:AbrB family looped-hinge helix DNA binding protein